MGTDKTLREIISDIKVDLLEISKDIISIKSALTGGEFGQNGLVKQMKDNTKRIDKLERFNWRLVGAVSVITGCINVLVIIIVKYL